MRNLTEILKLADFSEDAVNFFEKLYEKAKKNAEVMKCLDEAEKIYFSEGKVEEHMEKLCELMNENRFSTDMLFLLYCSVALKEVYKEKGHPDEMYLGVLTDLKCKVTECHDVYGVWGTFVFSWFQGFFVLKRFCLGRLQYEIIQSPIDYKDKVKEGDEVINCHIPSSGKLSPELVQDSLKRAYEFYGFRDEMIVHCASWMLYTPFVEAGVFPEGTNLRYFYDLFDVVELLPRDFGANAWRVFGVMETDIEKLPRDTGLRKRLYEFYKKEKSEGVGRGFFVYR